MPLAAGQSLSFYQILGPLGAGGMGEVYRGMDTRLEREVAIKVLPDEFTDDEERLRRFEREAKTLASLNHPNVAGIHGIDQEEDTCFLAMELVPGEDLEERLKRGALPLDEAIDVCRQISEGLEAAHEAGVVHRDLKPANVRITPEGVVKILDFGLAKPMGPNAQKSGTTSAQPDSVLMTSEGMILGTPTYMSPEQARGKPVDKRTDIWAFGCVLHECLTGKRAFEGEGFGELMAAILEHEVDLDALPAATPPHVRRLIARCLIKDPRERLRDIGEARLELSGKSSETAVVSPRPDASGASKASALAGWAGWIVAAGLLVLLVSRLGDAEPEAAISAPSVHARVLLPPDAELAF
ncbi:MAG: serine/threonine protein kinase, partial [Myxococcales bacterium]|nr:serine/threonine protein kinase [Myxococcales bacterium]